MCEIKFLKQTSSGILLFCNHSNLYQILFKNINFNLTVLELDGLRNYINNIDETYWEWEFKNSIYSKKIPLPTTQENLMILLNVSDLAEIRTLLNYKTNISTYISYRDIDYKIIFN